MDEMEKTNRKQADSWASQARKQGVETKVVFIPSGGNVPESIIKYAQTNHYGMIATASEVGPVAATFIGSISRQIMRDAPCPVWVYRGER
jgi:nucleotide-binding universal stress UspA family protein